MFDISQDVSREKFWSYSDSAMSVVNSFRDLGANLNMTMQGSNITGNQRLDDATISVQRVNRLPLSHREKSHVIRTRCHPKALYGCETSKLSENQQLAYAKAVKSAISNTTQHKGPNMTYCTSRHGPDIDSETHIFCRRVHAIRRSVMIRDR